MVATKFKDRLTHAWNAFQGVDRNPYLKPAHDLGIGSSYRIDRPRLSFGSERSIVSGVYTRIAMDVTSANIRHVRLDSNKRYLHDMDSGLNECLAVEANLDQTGTTLLNDVVLSLFDEGVVAIVPVETTFDPKLTNAYDIRQLRTGKVLEWFPQHVRVSVYDQRVGTKKELILPKTTVAIVENPLYAIMNEPNSILQRLIRKLSLLDTVDNNAGAGKLDMIIQLPYVIKSEARRQQAEIRRKDIEIQLAQSKYGIAYTDGTEKITQLNRPVENDLLNQVKYLTEQLYSHLGLTSDIITGTASDGAMTNYYSRTVDPILKAITEAMRRRFLTKSARTQGQSIMYYRDPFRLVPLAALATMADPLTRNAILSSNEIRAIMGYKPSDDPAANELSNKNMPVDKQTAAPVYPEGSLEPVGEPGNEEDYEIF